MSSASTLILVWLRPLRTISNSPAISLLAALICLNTPGLELMVSTVTLLSTLTTVYSISLSLATCSVRTVVFSAKVME